MAYSGPTQHTTRAVLVKGFRNWLIYSTRISEPDTHVPGSGYETSCTCTDGYQSGDV